MTVGELSTRVRSFLDDDSASSERYGLTTDILPAMNSAISYLVAVFSAAFDSKQIKPEVLTNLIKAKVLDSTATGVVAKTDISTLTNTGSVWRILGVEPNPTIAIGAYSDWYLPSKDGLNSIYTNLHLMGVGNFYSTLYWSSSEYSSTSAWMLDFSTGDQISDTKDTLARVRPVRSFTAVSGAYVIGDVGPAGGWIYYIDGTTYYEAAPDDLGGIHEWSNVLANNNITESLSPALIRNVEGDNVSESATTTLLEITAVSTNEITLGNLTATDLTALQGLVTNGIDWFAMSLDDYNVSTEPSYSGDYLTQTKVSSFDLDNGKINLVSATDFNIGDRIALYTPWANYEFLPGQENNGILYSASMPSWRSGSESSGPSWWDDVNERYILMFAGYDGATGYQTGFAYSTDLENWTIGNSDLPIIAWGDDPHFAGSVVPTGNAFDNGDGTMSFTIQGNDGTDRHIHLATCDKDDPTTITWTSTKLIDAVNLYPGGVAYFDGKYHILVSTMESTKNIRINQHYTCDTIDGTYTKLADMWTTEYDNKDSIWLEGSSTTCMPFVENGKLYAILGGEQRYTISGIQGNRVFGFMKYESGSWSPLNDFAPEILFPMYFYNIPSEDYGWAGGHTGGYPSFIKKDGKIYLFCAFLQYTDTYQVAALEISDNASGLDIGSTLTSIGSGSTNTDLIVAQDGHVSSAAEECLDNYDNATVSLSLGKMASRLTLEEWNHAQENPFMRGSTASIPSIFNELAYTGPGRFFGDNKDYILLRPASIITNDKVALYYLESPTELTASGDTIQFPPTLHNLIVQKTIQYLSYQHSKDAKYFQITDKDIKEVIGLMNI